jgi:phytoene dehydrogenase-like protein
VSQPYDAIIVGAGHNGLTTAARLARAGLRVLALERRDTVGGALVTEEIHPGFKVDVACHQIGALHPGVVGDLDQALGVTPDIVRCDPVVFAPLIDGRHLLLWRDPAITAEAIATLSKSDAENWSSFVELITKAAGLLETAYERTPPDLLSVDASDLWSLVRLGGRARRLGKREMMEVARLLTMTVAELLDEWFESDLLKGTLGATGVTGMFQGPMAAGTAYMLLHNHVGMENGAVRSVDRVRGGVGVLSHALHDLARSCGVEIRTNAPVMRIAVKNGRATGVVLANGDELEAERVISNADPRRTFLDLVDPLDLAPRFVRQVQNIKYRGACAKVNLALDALPNFTCGDAAHLGGVVSISPSLDYLERAYDDAKYGEISREPYLETVIPSLVDPSLAPAGKHVMSILVQYAPYHLKGDAWDDSRNSELADRAVDTLVQYAPNLEQIVLARHVLSPRDLETDFGLTEGNIYHGEMTLDQLFFMRPVPGWARYRTPIENLYLCGAGTHPGGGVTTRPGYNAAREILKDVKRSSRGK